MICAAAVLLPACCPPPANGTWTPGLSSVHFAGLPRERQALVALADAQVQGSPQPPELYRAVAALLQAASMQAAPRYELQWRLARAYFLLSETLPERRRRLEAAQQGIQHAQQAAALEPARVEGHYYLALDLAKVAEASSDLALIKPAVAAAERARSVDETYDGAGPLVFLGKVFLTAPSWPVSVGNVELAIELLERALLIAPRPLTRVFLGEAYLKDEEYERAREQLRRALEQAEQLAPRWRQEAEELLRQANEESSARCSTGAEAAA